MVTPEEKSGRNHGGIYKFNGHLNSNCMYYHIFLQKKRLTHHGITFVTSELWGPLFKPHSLCACWPFRSICKEDPGNLNAWANLGYVYDKLGRELDAGECVEKVSQFMGLEAGVASQDESRLLAARCLAEQAYVYPYDVELDSEDDLRERLTAALRLYNRALDYGGQLVR